MISLDSDWATDREAKRAHHDTGFSDLYDPLYPEMSNPKLVAAPWGRRH